MHTDSAPCYRAAMWIGIALVSLCVLHDPYSIPLDQVDQDMYRAKADGKNIALIAQGRYWLAS